MSSLSSLTAQPRRLTVAGQVFELHPLTLDDLGQLQGWIDQQFPDPFKIVSDAIAHGNYNVAQQQYLFSQAMDRAVRPRHLIGTPEADRLLQTVDGMKKMLVLSIRKGRPGFSEAEAEALYRQLDLGDVQTAFAATEVSLVMADPKDGKTTSATSGKTTSRSRRRSA